MVDGGGGCCSVGFVRGEQGRVHWLHAGGTGEGAHQPGVDAVHVVNVEAGQEPNGIAVLKIHHADHTPGAERNGGNWVRLIVLVFLTDTNAFRH